MSHHANATSSATAEGLVGAALAYAATSPSRALLLALINIPLIAVAINVFLQFLPKDKSLPPVVFHWLPFVGSAPSYGQDPLQFFFDCQKKYGNIFTFILLGRKVTVALGPKGNNFILGGKGRSFNAEEAYKHLTVPVFGKDVVYDIPNDKFMEQKKFVKVGLSIENFRAYMGMIEDEVTRFMEHDSSWHTYQLNDTNEWGTLKDVVDVLSEITILTASRTLQGTEVRAGLDKSFAQLYTDLDGGFTPLNFMFPNLPLPSYRRRDAAQAKMSEFYQDIIRRRRSSGQTGNDEEEHDMLAALMEQKYRDGQVLRDHEIAHIMIALLMAGQHTSSATGSWTLLHLADNPDIAEALYQEQVKHFQEADGTFRTMRYEELRDLPVLDSVIRETLRVHPPIHSIMRKVQDDVVVPGTLATPDSKSDAQTYVVPQGHYVLASPLVSQMDPATWRDAKSWQPTRWSDPEGTAAQAFDEYNDENGEKVDFGFGAVSKGTDSPYQPFGAGRHRCIGEQFAYLQLSVIVATIVRRIEMRIHGKFPEHNYHTMITMPTNPRQIMYRRRKHD